MRPGQRQTILSSVRHHRYTSYHFIPRNSHSKDGWNGYIDYLCRDRRTKPRTLLPIGRTYLTNERDRIHQHRRLGFPIFRTAKKRASGYYFLCWRYARSGIAPAYNASKAYQINYMEGLRQKATKSPYSIYTTDIRPGFVDTAMAKGEGLFWVTPVDKAVKQIKKAISKKKKVAFISKRWRYVTILFRLLPSAIYCRM